MKGEIDAKTASSRHVGQMKLDATHREGQPASEESVRGRNERIHSRASRGPQGRGAASGVRTRTLPRTPV